jgi:hypothetical protein
MIAAYAGQALQVQLLLPFDLRLHLTGKSREWY